MYEHMFAQVDYRRSVLLYGRMGPTGQDGAPYSTVTVPF